MLGVVRGTPSNASFPGSFDEDAYMRDFNEQKKSGLIIFDESQLEKNLCVLEKVKELLPFNDIYKVHDCDLIYRFLIGKHWNVEEAVEGIRLYVEMRKKDKVNEVLGESFPDDLLSVTASVYGVDKNNKPVLWCCPDTESIFSVLKDYSKEDILRVHLRQMEQARLCALLQGTDRCTYVLDMSKLSVTSFLSGKYLDFLKEVMRLLQTYYPEVMTKLIICNVNTAVKWGWSFLKHVVDPRIHEKLVFITKPPSVSALEPHIREEHVHPRYVGGKARKEENLNKGIASTRSEGRSESTGTESVSSSTSSTSPEMKGWKWGKWRSPSRSDTGQRETVVEKDQKGVQEVEDMLVKRLQMESSRVADCIKRGAPVFPPHKFGTDSSSEEEAVSRPESAHRVPHRMSILEDQESIARDSGFATPPLRSFTTALSPLNSSPIEHSLDESMFSVYSCDPEWGLQGVTEKEGMDELSNALGGDASLEGDARRPSDSLVKLGSGDTFDAQSEGCAAPRESNTMTNVEKSEGDNAVSHGSSPLLAPHALGLSGSIALLNDGIGEERNNSKVKDHKKKKLEKEEGEQGRKSGGHVTTGFRSLEENHPLFHALNESVPRRSTSQGITVVKRSNDLSVSPSTSRGVLSLPVFFHEERGPPPFSNALTQTGGGGVGYGAQKDSTTRGDKIVKVEGIATGEDRRCKISTFERCTKLVLTYTMNNKIFCSHQGRCCALMENSRIYTSFPNEGIDNDDQDGMGILITPQKVPSFSRDHKRSRSHKGVPRVKDDDDGDDDVAEEDEDEENPQKAQDHRGTGYTSSGTFGTSKRSFPTRGRFSNLEQGTVVGSGRREGKVSRGVKDEERYRNVHEGLDSRVPPHPAGLEGEENDERQLSSFQAGLTEGEREDVRVERKEGYALLHQGQVNYLVRPCSPCSSFWMLSGELLHASGHYIHSTLLVCDGERRVNFILKRSNFHRRITVHMVVGSYREVQTTADQMHFFPLNGKGSSSSSSSAVPVGLPRGSCAGSADSFHANHSAPPLLYGHRHDSPLGSLSTGGRGEGRMGGNNGMFGSPFSVNHPSHTDPSTSLSYSSFSSTARSIDELRRESIHIGTVVPHCYSSSTVKSKRRGKKGEEDTPVVVVHNRSSTTSGVGLDAERCRVGPSSKEGKEAWMMLGTKVVVLQDSPGFWRRRFPNMSNKGIINRMGVDVGGGGSGHVPPPLAGSSVSGPRGLHHPDSYDHRVGGVHHSATIAPRSGAEVGTSPYGVNCNNNNNEMYRSPSMRSPSGFHYPAGTSFSRSLQEYNNGSGMTFFEPSSLSSGGTSDSPFGMSETKAGDATGGGIEGSSPFLKSSSSLSSSGNSLRSTIAASVRRVLPFFDETTSVMVGEHRDQVLLFYGDLAFWFQPQDLFALGAAITSLWVK